MKFFTADPHFNHSNIIRYCNRPFKDVMEMNKALIDNWNSVVTEEDEVFIAGDLGFGNVSPILAKLNGAKIYMLPGSHDKNIKAYRSDRFTITDTLLNLIIENQMISLCHYCLRTWRASHYNSFHLYGHSHGKLPPIGKSWDIGVDTNNFTPISWDQVKEIMANRPDNPNLVHKRMDVGRSVDMRRGIDGNDVSS